MSPIRRPTPLPLQPSLTSFSLVNASKHGYCTPMFFLQFAGSPRLALSACGPTPLIESDEGSHDEPSTIEVEICNSQLNCMYIQLDTNPYLGISVFFIV